MLKVNVIKGQTHQKFQKCNNSKLITDIVKKKRKIKIVNTIKYLQRKIIKLKENLTQKYQK